MSAAAIGNSIITGMSKPPSRGSTIEGRAATVDQKPGHAQPPQDRPVDGLESFHAELLGLGGSGLAWHGWTLSRRGQCQ
jgi:hypothetical protein